MKKGTSRALVRVECVIVFRATSNALIDRKDVLPRALGAMRAVGFAGRGLKKGQAVYFTQYASKFDIVTA